MKRNGADRRATSPTLGDTFRGRQPQGAESGIRPGGCGRARWLRGWWFRRASGVYHVSLSENPSVGGVTPRMRGGWLPGSLFLYHYPSCFRVIHGWARGAAHHAVGRRFHVLDRLPGDIDPSLVLALLMQVFTLLAFGAFSSRLTSGSKKMAQEVHALRIAIIGSAARLDGAIGSLRKPLIACRLREVPKHRRRAAWTQSARRRRVGSRVASIHAPQVGSGEA